MRSHKIVTPNFSWLRRTVNAQPISPGFASGMELPAYWICWTRREYNCRPKMLMRKAIPTALSLQFYCTNRLPVDGLNGLLSLREAQAPEALTRTVGRA